MGFRVVSLPEPGMGAMLLIGVLSLAGLRRLKRSPDSRASQASLYRGRRAARAARVAARRSRRRPVVIGGGHRGGSFTWDSEGKPDATPLPPDPRTLAQPGTNAGKAVYINTYWKNCHVDPAAVQEVGAAETCGELRARFDAARRCSTRAATARRACSREQPGPTAHIDLHAPTSTTRSGRSGAVTRSARNFDELAAERYGSAFSASPIRIRCPARIPTDERRLGSCPSCSPSCATPAAT